MWTHVNEWAKVAVLVIAMIFVMKSYDEKCDCDKTDSINSESSNEEIISFLQKKFPGTTVEPSSD